MRATFLIVAVAFIGGCKSKDPLYCDGVTPCTAPGRPFCDLNGEYPASEGVGRTCIPDPIQDGGLPDSGLDGDAAVPCTQTSCVDPTRPVCDQQTRQCRGCTADAKSECASEVCDDSTGMCTTATDIIYVDPNAAGTDSPGCGTPSAPCATLVHAATLVEPTRNIIRARPSAYVAPGPILDKAMTIVAPGSSLSTELGVTGIAIVVNDGGSLTIEGATIGRSGASGGLSCAGTTSTPTLALRGAVVLDNPSTAPGNQPVIETLRCRLSLDRTSITGHVIARRTVVEMFQSTVSNSRAIGLELNTSTAQLSRTTISGGRAHAVMALDSDFTADRSLFTKNGAGIVLSNSDFTITNSIIAKNGDGSMATGGLSFRNSPAGKRTILRFNTIVANVNNGGVVVVNGTPVGSGVGCDEIVQSEPFAGNIVRSNAGGPNVGASCQFEHSNVAGIIGGTGNFDEDAKLVDQANDNFHLTSLSSCRNRPGLPAPPAHDFDGDNRPLENAADVGADEFTP